MSDAKWPRFDARKRQRSWCVEYTLRLDHVFDKPGEPRLLKGNLSEQAARDMARDLNLAREARALAEAVEPIMRHDHNGTYRVCPVCLSHDKHLMCGDPIVHAPRCKLAAYLAALAAIESESP